MIFRDDDISYRTKLENFKKVHELFEQCNVVHTIALMAKDIEKAPDLIAFINSKNIDVQLHCWDHIDLTLNHDRVKEHLQQGIDCIKKQFNKTPTILYPPWNLTDSTVNSIAQELGLTVCADKISLNQYLRARGDVKEKVINFHSWDNGDYAMLQEALRIYRHRNRFKVTVISANIGDFDYDQDHVQQNMECDFYHFTENNLPVPLPNLNNRLKGKWLKTQMHRAVPGYDVYIWLDGRVRITSPFFVKNYIDLLKGVDMVATLHPDRTNVYEELEYMMMEIERGEPYLTARYANEPLREELDFYKTTEFPADYPLYAALAFAMWSNDKVKQFTTDWWLSCIEWSNFDQSQFSYHLWRHGMRSNTIPFNNDFFKVGKHK